MSAIRYTSIVLVSLYFLLLYAPAHAANLSDANNFIRKQKYDEAITILKRLAKRYKKKGAVYNTLGKAYHWKKDNENALKYYRLAAKYNKKYRTSPLPMLSSFGMHDEIVKIGEEVIADGDRRPHIFGALLIAYFDLEEMDKYNRTLKQLKKQKYKKKSSIEYQMYALGKEEARAGRQEEALTYILKIKGKTYLNYMWTDSVFANMRNNERYKKFMKKMIEISE